MSIIVYMDEQTFKVTYLTHSDRLTGRVTDKVGGERPFIVPLLEDASPTGRSAAHPRRYAGNSD